jgi:hypothetical protein
MNRIHSTLIALVVAAATGAGAYAAVHTVRLGQKAQAPAVSPHAAAVRQAKLVAWHHSLEAALAKRPPKLPKLPHFAPVPSPAPAAPPVVTASSPPVTYVQAPPVVKYQHAPSTSHTPASGSGDDNSGDGGGDGGGD